jgi:molecular chaperone Hsp31 and glyoxalase 3
MIRKLLGIAPKSEGDGAFSPSPLARVLATSDRTDWDGELPEPPAEPRRTVLVVCTEEGRMTMANGRVFATGNHPVETFVPMLHMERAGFTFEIATLSGAPVALEEWAMPRKDDVVMAYRERWRARFEHPRSVAELADAPLDDYAAVFIPGGHGAMLGLPESEALGRLLHRFVADDRLVLAICHGPAALLATATDGDFAFEGKAMAVFPDGLDRKTPWMGYLPGPVPWYVGERLKERGVTIVNDKANGTCHRDGALITGDSPDAAYEFGQLAAEALTEATAP